MSDEELQMIPLVAYDRMITSYERHLRRMTITVIILIILLAVTNGIWVYEWSRYDYVDDYSVEVDSGDGNINYIGQDGDIYDGTDNGTQAQNESET